MRLSGFNLNQLVALEALLSERNVTRAADRVHLSQSAMSTVLAQLRDHFSDELLVRSGRQLILTPFAKSLIAPLTEVLTTSRRFAALRPDQADMAIDRELKIVASDHSVQTFLAEAVKQAIKDMPGLHINILPLTDTSPRLLQDGEIDLLIAGQSLNVGAVPHSVLRADRFVCLACADNGPQAEKLTRQEYLDRTHLVVRYFEHQLAFEDEEVLRLAGVKRIHQVSAWSFSMVPYLLSGTPMIATVTNGIAQQLYTRWPLSIYEFPFAHNPIQVFSYIHPSRHDDVVLSRFQDVIKRVNRNAS